MIFDSTRCTLGEGVLWHPMRQSLLWFDIMGQSLYERSLSDVSARQWHFDCCVSAAGWVHASILVIASEKGLMQLDLNTGMHSQLIDVEAKNPSTRSNDGRADCYGGFWMSTMGKQAQEGAGSIYRYYKGAMHRLYEGLSIPNSICFAPDGKRAYYCDTPTKKIMQVALDSEGWPTGDPQLFVDTAPHHPDGSVVDSVGNLWNAQWGANRVCCYDAQGKQLLVCSFPAAHISCPAFGGTNQDLLFATSATLGLAASGSADGCTFVQRVGVAGQVEHQVTL